MQLIDELKKRLELATDEQITTIISHGTLKMNDTQTATVSFVFWICYLAERELENVLVEAWKKTKEILSTDNDTIVYIRNKYKIRNEIIDTSDPNYKPNDITFTDKIDIFQKINGDTKMTKFLWKLKRIRNDLSHGRIDDLKYDGDNLYTKEIKEKMLIDYFDCLLNNDWKNQTKYNDNANTQQNT